jgi:hypothetical protein
VLSSIRIDQAAWAKPGHDFGKTRIGNGEAALASTEHAGVSDHLLINVPGTMHYDRPVESVAIGRVESLEPYRVTMGTDIKRTRSIGSCGGRIRARLVGETLEPSCMRGVRTPSVCNQMRPHAAISKAQQVEPRCTRRKGEVSDADKVSVADAVLMSLQSIERTPKQSGSYLTVDTVCSSEREPSPRDHRSRGHGRQHH